MTGTNSVPEASVTMRYSVPGVGITSPVAHEWHFLNESKIYSAISDIGVQVVLSALGMNLRFMGVSSVTLREMHSTGGVRCMWRQLVSRFSVRRAI